MVKVYAIVLVVGLLALLLMLLGGPLLEAASSRSRALSAFNATSGKSVVGALIGFGMGGMAAEFSRLDLSWQLSLALAITAGFLAVLWVRYSSAKADAR